MDVCSGSRWESGHPVHCTDLETRFCDGLDWPEVPQDSRPPELPAHPGRSVSPAPRDAALPRPAAPRGATTPSGRGASLPACHRLRVPPATRATPRLLLGLPLHLTSHAAVPGQGLRPSPPPTALMSPRPMAADAIYSCRLPRARSLHSTPTQQPLHIPCFPSRPKQHWLDLIQPRSLLPSLPQPQQPHPSAEATRSQEPPLTPVPTNI